MVGVCFGGSGNAESCLFSASMPPGSEGGITWPGGLPCWGHVRQKGAPMGVAFPGLKSQW